MNRTLTILWVAAILLSSPALADDDSNLPWKVYQSGISLCCSFATLHDAHEFVRMNQGNGNSYLIVKENNKE